MAACPATILLALVFLQEHADMSPVAGIEYFGPGFPVHIGANLAAEFVLHA